MSRMNDIMNYSDDCIGDLFQLVHDHKIDRNEFESILRMMITFGRIEKRKPDYHPPVWQGKTTGGGVYEFG